MIFKTGNRCHQVNDSKVPYNANNPLTANHKDFSVMFIGLSSQYKIRKAKRENKVLAAKQNLNNESEEGTKITV